MNSVVPRNELKKNNIFHNAKPESQQEEQLRVTFNSKNTDNSHKMRSTLRPIPKYNVT